MTSIVDSDYKVYKSAEVNKADKYTSKKMIYNIQKSLPEKKLNYLLSLSKNDPKELLYLLNLNTPQILIKQEEFILKNSEFRSILDGRESILDRRGEYRFLHRHKSADFVWADAEE